MRFQRRRQPEPDEPDTGPLPLKESDAWRPLAPLTPDQIESLKLLSLRRQPPG